MEEKYEKFLPLSHKIDHFAKLTSFVAHRGLKLISTAAKKKLRGPIEEKMLCRPLFKEKGLQEHISDKYDPFSSFRQL